MFKAIVLDPNPCRSGGGARLHIFFLRRYAAGSRNELADKSILRVLPDHIDVLAIQLGAHKDEFETSGIARPLLENLPNYKPSDLRLITKAEQKMKKENEKEAMDVLVRA